MASAHCIDELVVDISFSSKALAKRENSRLTQWLSQELLPELEQLFEHYLRGPRILRFERLEFDFGNLSASDYQEVITRQLLAKMRALIEERSLALPAAQQMLLENSQPFASQNTSALEQLVLFLRTGQLPWYSNQGGDNQAVHHNSQHRAALHQQLLTGLMDHPGLASAILQIPEKPIMVERLVKQFDRALLRQLLSRLAPSQAENIALLLNVLEAALAESMLNETSLGSAYQFLLLRFTRGTQIPKDTPNQAAWLEDFFKLVSQSSFAPRASAAKLLHRLRQLVAVEDSEGLITRAIDRQLRVFNENNSEALVAGNRQKLEPSINLLPINNALSSTLPHAENDSPQESQPENHHLQNELPLTQSAAQLPERQLTENRLVEEQRADAQFTDKRFTEKHLTEKQLVYLIAQAFIQGLPTSLESLWAELIANHKAYLQGAIKKYLPQTEVRLQILINFPEYMVRDIFSLYQPDLGAEASENWEVVANYLAQLEGVTETSTELIRALWEISFNLVAGKTGPKYSSASFKAAVVDELVRRRYLTIDIHQQLMSLIDRDASAPQTDITNSYAAAENKKFSTAVLDAANPIIAAFIAQNKITLDSDNDFADFVNLWNGLTFNSAASVSASLSGLEVVNKNVADAIKRIAQRPALLKAIFTFAAQHPQYLQKANLGAAEWQLLCEQLCEGSYENLFNRVYIGEPPTDPAMAARPLSRQEVLIALETIIKSKRPPAENFYAQLFNALIQQDAASLQQLLFAPGIKLPAGAEGAREFSELLSRSNTQPITLDQTGASETNDSRPIQDDYLLRLVSLLREGEINLADIELNEAIAIQLINKYLTGDTANHTATDTAAIAVEYREDLFNSIMTNSQKAIHKLGYYRSVLHSLLTRAPLDFEAILASNGKASAALEAAIYEGEFIREASSPILTKKMPMAKLAGTSVTNPTTQQQSAALLATGKYLNDADKLAFKENLPGEVVANKKIADGHIADEKTLHDLLNQLTSGTLSVRELNVTAPDLQRLVHAYLPRITGMTPDNRLRLLITITRQAAAVANARAYYQVVLQNLIDGKALDFNELIATEDIEKIPAGVLPRNDEAELRIKFENNQEDPLELIYVSIKQGEEKLADLNISASEFARLVSIALQNAHGFPPGKKDYFQFTLQKLFAKAKQDSAINSLRSVYQSVLQAVLESNENQLALLIADLSKELMSAAAVDPAAVNIAQASAPDLWRLLESIRSGNLVLEDVAGSAVEMEHLVNFFLLHSNTIATGFRADLHSTINKRAQTVQNRYVFFRKILMDLLAGQALDFSQAEVSPVTELQEHMSQLNPSREDFLQADVSTAAAPNANVAIEALANDQTPMPSPATITKQERLTQLYASVKNHLINLMQADLSFEALSALVNFIGTQENGIEQSQLYSLQALSAQAKNKPEARHKLIRMLELYIRGDNAAAILESESLGNDPSDNEAASITLTKQENYQAEKAQELFGRLASLIDDKFDHTSDAAAHFFRAVTGQAEQVKNKIAFLTQVITALEEDQLIDLEIFSREDNAVSEQNFTLDEFAKPTSDSNEAPGQVLKAAEPVPVVNNPEIKPPVGNAPLDDAIYDVSSRPTENHIAVNDGQKIPNETQKDVNQNFATEISPAHSEQAHEQFVYLLVQGQLSTAEAVRFQQLAQQILARADAAAIKLWLNADTSQPQLQLLVQYLPSPALHKLLQIAYPQEYAPVDAWAKILMDALALEVTSIYAVAIHNAKWQFVLERVLFASTDLSNYLADFSNQLAEAAGIDAIKFRNLVERRIALLKNKSKNNIADLQGNSQENKFRSEPAQQDNELLTEALLEGVHLMNAGQVLAAPFLPRLFSMLQLTDQGQFVGMAAADRAAHLVQYMVTGAAYHPEYDLLLNKVLCGISTSLPLSAGIEVSEQEKTIIEQMLTSMIQHWRVLGSTSIAGFRQTFLQRQGWLSLEEDGWRLRVQPGPFDMLLDQLPWNISIIKHGWMNQPLRVSWR